MSSRFWLKRNVNISNQINFSGPACSKLTSPLVNVSLKFQTLISEKCHFLLKKKMRSFSHFFNKNISVYGYKVVKYLTSWPLNEFVKQKMLWTTGPRCLSKCKLHWVASKVYMYPFGVNSLCTRPNVAYISINIRNNDMIKTLIAVFHFVLLKTFNLVDQI